MGGCLAGKASRRRRETLTAYLIADIDVTDPAAFEEYRVAAVDERYGAKFLAGGAIRVLEGSWRPSRPALVEFADMATLMRWYDSPEYARIRPIRQRSTTSRIVGLDGSR